MHSAREFGRRGDTGAADLSDQLHLAQRQAMVGPVPAHLPRHGHHRFPQFGGWGVHGCHNQVIPWQILCVTPTDACCMCRNTKGILVINMAWMRRMLRWVLLIAVTVAVTFPLTRVGVPSAALFAALIVGNALALTSLAPARIPRPGGVAAQGVLGVYIGTMVHQDAVGALGADWPIVIAIAAATLLLSIVAGALLGLHRDVTPLTGSLAQVAGGPSGVVALARELGGDDRVVSVVQYLRVALVTA